MSRQLRTELPCIVHQQRAASRWSSSPREVSKTRSTKRPCRLRVLCVSPAYLGRGRVLPPLGPATVWVTLPRDIQPSSSPLPSLSPWIPGLWTWTLRMRDVCEPLSSVRHVFYTYSAGAGSAADGCDGSSSPFDSDSDIGAASALEEEGAGASSPCMESCACSLCENGARIHDTVFRVSDVCVLVVQSARGL